MRVLLDTNILLRLSQEKHPLHVVTSHVVGELLTQGHEIRLIPQVIYEYWVVATRSARENGLGFSTKESKQHLVSLKQMFPVLRDERGVLNRWETLVHRHEVRGKPAHDARIVAAMQRHDVTHLLTWNVGDFRRYSGIAIIDPGEYAPPPM